MYDLLCAFTVSLCSSFAGHGTLLLTPRSPRLPGPGLNKVFEVTRQQILNASQSKLEGSTATPPSLVIGSGLEIHVADALTADAGLIVSRHVGL